MNTADYAILVVLGLSVLVGLWRGLVVEVMALVVWIAAFWIARLFGEQVAAWFDPAVSVPSARIALGYGTCFLAVLLGGALLRFLLSRLVAGTGLSGTDRLLGMVFGLVRGAVLVTLVVLLAGFTPLPRDAWWQESRLLPMFGDGAAWLAANLPQGVREHLDFDPAALSMAGAAVPAALDAWLPAASASTVAPAASTVATPSTQP